MTLQPRRADGTDIAGIFAEHSDDGWPPRVGDKVSNCVDDGSELIEGYVLGSDDGEHFTVLVPVGRPRGVYDVRIRTVRIDELDRGMTTRAAVNQSWVQANNLLLAAVDLPRPSTLDWLRYVGWATTLRKGSI